MDSAFLQARISSTQALIVAYEDVLAKLATNPARSYTINTGQTTETVSRWDVDKIQDAIDRLYSQLDAMEARLNGNASIVVTGGGFY